MKESKSLQYEKEMIECIQKHEWARWAHIEWDVLSFSRPTAYNHNLDKLDTIKEAFEIIRSKATNYMLKKWILSDNATLQIAAFKIVASEDDHKRLNQSFVEQKSIEVNLPEWMDEE
jgi:hypothetical protein